MSHNEDKFWQTIVNILGHPNQNSPLTPEQAQSIYDSLPDDEIAVEEIDSIVSDVLSDVRASAHCKQQTFDLPSELGPSSRQLKVNAASTTNSNGDFIEDEHVQAHFAMAANDGAAPSFGAVGFFRIGAVRIDGMERDVLSDGRRIAIRLNSGESPIGLWIDKDVFEVTLAAGGKLAVLANYWRGDADQLLMEVECDIASHALRWRRAPASEG